MKNPARKYIDLIHTSSSKWANWDPPRDINVGDYGKINKGTGEFEREGNIYEHPETAALAANHLPVTAPPDDTFMVSSYGVRRNELKLGAEAGITGIAEASIKGHWEFGTKRGALLIMAQPRSTHIPPHVFLKELIKIPLLKHKSLVTEVISCPAYMLYLSGASNDTLALALVATLPSGAPAAALGGTAQMSWWSQYSSGLFRGASDKDGSYCYKPLYTLKKFRKRGLLRRDDPVPEPEGDDLWDDVQEPWNPFNDEGEEEEFYDTVYD